MKGWSVEKVDEELTYEERKEFNEKYKQLERDAIEGKDSDPFFITVLVLVFFASFSFYVFTKYDSVDRRVADCYTGDY